MRIYPIINFNNAEYKKNIYKTNGFSYKTFSGKNQKNASDTSFMGADSLEILGNYGAAKVQADEKKKNGNFNYKERVSNVKAFLEQSEKFNNPKLDNILSTLSKNEKIFDIQKELIFALSKSKKIRPNSLESVLSCISENEKVAQIQKETLLGVLESEKYGVLEICDAAEEMSEYNEDVAEIQRDMIFSLLPDERLSGMDINELAFSLSEKSTIAQIQCNLVSELIHNKKFSTPNIKAITSAISPNRQGALFQRDSVFELSENSKFSGNDIAVIIYGMGEAEKKPIMELQKNLVLQLAKKDRLSGEEIATICHRIQTYDINITKHECDFALKLSQYENFSGSDIKKSLYSYYVNKDKDELVSLLEENGFMGYKSVAKSFDKILSDIYERPVDFLFKMKEKGFLDRENSIFERKSLPIYAVHTFLSNKNNKLYSQEKKEAFLDYFGKIDFEKLEEIAPAMKDFSLGNYLIFALYHFQKGGKTEFTKKDLNFGDLTEFLSENYLDGTSMMNLLSAFPETKTEVGEIPDVWLDKIPNDKKEDAQKKIYMAIDNFVKQRNNSYCFSLLNNTIDDSIHNDESALSSQLGKILKKKVNVEKIGSGVYGTGYKISVQGAGDFCLKAFRDIENCEESDIFKKHGEHAEVQMGLFANRHSKKFVKMYFGRVSLYGTKQKGFIVTQFLDDDTEIEKPNVSGIKKYGIFSSDAEGNHNMKQGIIFDYGGLSVRNRLTDRPVKPYDIFEK